MTSGIPTISTILQMVTRRPRLHIHRMTLRIVTRNPYLLAIYRLGIFLTWRPSVKPITSDLLLKTDKETEAQVLGSVPRSQVRSGCASCLCGGSLCWPHSTGNLPGSCVTPRAGHSPRCCLSWPGARRGHLLFKIFPGESNVPPRLKMTALMHD